MNLKRKITWGFALWLGWASVSAQEAVEIERLQRQLKELQDDFERMQQQQRLQIDSLRKQIESLRESAPVQPARDAAPPAEEKKAAPADPAEIRKPWSPADPMRLWSQGPVFMNLSLDGLFAAGTSTAEDVAELQTGAHDPNQRGFTLQNLEATFDGAVDPYVRGQANLIFQIDAEGESVLEVEEAFLESLSLPGNLQVKAGQYFTEFGRLNPTHPHLWSFVDQPLVNGRFLGPDGLRNPGARLAWLAPTPFYSELFFSVQNSQGETAASFRNAHEEEVVFGRRHEVDRVQSFGDLLLAPRYVASFDFTETQTWLLGASGAFGPNATGTGSRTEIYGLDLFWKWKPLTHSGGFPFLAWQTEAMWRELDAAPFDWDLDGNGSLGEGELDGDGDGVPDLLPGESLTDYGLYSQLTYGFRKGWVAGLRGDYVTSDRAGYETLLGRDPLRATRWRLSPNLTWFPSEFTKVRLQYNYDDRQTIGTDHSIWLQFEFMLGSHGAHKF